MNSDVFELCRVYWDSHPELLRPSNAPPPAEDNNSGSSSSNENEREDSPQPDIQSIKREEEEELDIKDAHDSDEEMDEESEKEVEEEQEPPKKKAKSDDNHIPHYMTEKGFDFNKSWPHANTNWTTAMKKFHAIQLSPIDKNMKLAFIEW